MNPSRTLVGLAVGSATVALVGVGAVARGATEPTMAKACVNSADGLRLKSHGQCPAGDHAITIGQRGPQGKTGASGIGPAWYSPGRDDDTQVYATSTPTEITDVTVPAGKYVVTFSASLQDEADMPVNTVGSCGVGFALSPNNDDDATFDTSDLISVSGINVVTGPTNIALNCVVHGGDQLSATGDIVAEQVSDLHVNVNG